jgi:hypothetical protein
MEPPQSVKSQIFSKSMSTDNMNNRSLPRADYDRWSDVKNHRAAWDGRNQIIAQLIPDNASVFEFGAGRRILERYLKPTNKYTPSDIVSRGVGTYICDLNQRPLPCFPKHDIAVFSGVLEYLYGLKTLPSALSDSFPTVIASYSILENTPSLDERRAFDWKNHYSFLGFIQVFEQCGYICSENVYPWKKQIIFLFSLPK